MDLRKLEISSTGPTAPPAPTSMSMQPDLYSGSWFAEPKFCSPPVEDASSAMVSVAAGRMMLPLLTLDEPAWDCSSSFSPANSTTRYSPHLDSPSSFFIPVPGASNSSTPSCSSSPAASSFDFGTLSPADPCNFLPGSSFHCPFQNLSIGPPSTAASTGSSAASTVVSTSSSDNSSSSSDHVLNRKRRQRSGILCLPSGDWADFMMTIQPQELPDEKPLFGWGQELGVGEDPRGLVDGNPFDCGRAQELKTGGVSTGLVDANSFGRAQELEAGQNARGLVEADVFGCGQAQKQVGGAQNSGGLFLELPAGARAASGGRLPKKVPRFGTGFQIGAGWLETGLPETGSSGTGYVEMGGFETGHFGTDYSKMGGLETGSPETGYPETGYSEMGFSEMGYPETGYPETDYSETGYLGTDYPQNRLGFAGVKGMHGSTAVKAPDLKIVSIDQYSWRNEELWVRIFIPLPGVHELPDSCILAHYGSESVKVTVQDFAKGIQHKLVFKQLYGEIVPQDCSFYRRADKLVLKLVKVPGRMDSYNKGRPLEWFALKFE